MRWARFLAAGLLGYVLLEVGWAYLARNGGWSAIGNVTQAYWNGQ